MTQGRNRKDNKSKQSTGGSRSYSTRGERPASASQSRRAASSSQQRTPAGASRAAERKQEREKERRRRQLITIAAIIGGAILLAIALYFIVQSPAEAPIPETALTRYEGVLMTRTQEGYPLLGDPNAPVRAAVYSSFDCPHCRTFHDETMDAIVERVRDGNLSFVFVPLYGTGGVTNGQGAARAAVCIADQGRFWQFHDALFDWQGRYANQAFTNNRITSGVDALNLDRGAFDNCVRGDRPTTVLDAAQAEARSLLNFFGTPTVTINGVVPVGEDQQPIAGSEAIIAAIDRAIASLGRTTATAEPAAEATVEATAEATPEVTPVEQPEATPEATEAG